ncbi:hypothetical protein ACEPAH_9573 [Sanghuangporus vaninii]
MDSSCITDPHDKVRSEQKDVRNNSRIAGVRRRKRRGLRFTRVKNERAKKAKAKAVKATRSGGPGERVGTSKWIRAKAKKSLISRNTAAYKRKEESSDSAIVITRTLRSRTLAIAVQRATKAKRYRSLAPEPSEGLIQAERERDRLPSPLLFEDNPIASAHLAMTRPGGQVQDEGNTPRATNGGEECGVVSDMELGSTSWIAIEANELDGDTNLGNDDSESQLTPLLMPMDHADPQESIMQEQEDQYDHHGTSAGTDFCQSEINIDDPASAYIICASQRRECVNNGRHAKRGHRRTRNMFFDDPRDDANSPEEDPAPLPTVRLYDRRPFVNQALQSHETTIIHDRIHRPGDSLYWFSG